MKTKVIFYKDKNGEIFAYFPEMMSSWVYIARKKVVNYTSYSHIGQHSGCSPDYIKGCEEIEKESEYIALKTELESIGYDLEVI